MVNGLLFGKFAPLTRGHVSMIAACLKHCDHLYLFLSFDQKFIDTQPPKMRDKLSLIYRMRDLKDLVENTTGDIKNRITVSYVDESDIPTYPEGSLAYANLIRKALPEGVSLSKAFSSEVEYGEYFSEYFPECTHVIIDAERKTVPISATQFRNAVFDNYNMLSSPARERFVKKVAIVGVESTGKSTLTKALAKHFGARYTPEVGRDICEQDFHSSEYLMQREDYLHVAMKHRLEEKEKIRRSPVGVVFSDTTNLITHFSAVCAGKVSVADPLFLELSREEGDNFYDLILYLQPDVPWVSDPLRLQNTPEKRKQTNTILAGMIYSAYDKDKVVRISGEDYGERTSCAIAAVESLIYPNKQEEA